MNVETILRTKGREVATIGPDETAGAAVDELISRNIGAIVVSKDGESVDGIISERDVVHALATRGAHLNDLRSQRGSAIRLDLRSVPRHYDDRLHAHGAGRVGDSLSVVAAGVRDNTAPSFFVRERSNLVVSPPELERSDRLQALRFEKEQLVCWAGLFRRLLVSRREITDQGCACCYPTQSPLCSFDVVERYHAVIIEPLQMKS